MRWKQRSAARDFPCSTSNRACPKREADGPSARQSPWLAYSMKRSSSSARGIGNPRQILRSCPSLRICHGLHLPRRLPHPPIPTLPRRFASPPCIRSRARRAQCPRVEPSRIPALRGYPRSGSPRALGIPDRSPGQEMLSARPRPTASLFPRPENRSASYGWPGQARADAAPAKLSRPPHCAGSAPHIPGTPERSPPR